MRKDQHIEIEGVPVMLSSERGSITHGNAPRATPVVNWSVFYGGETIARALNKDAVLKRARAVLEKLGKLPPKVAASRYVVRYRGREASLPVADVERIRASVQVVDASDRMFLVQGDDASVRALTASLPSWRVTLEVDVPLPRAPLPRASRVASRYLTAAELRIKLPKLEGYQYALDAVFSEEDDDTALDWFAAACSPEGAPLDQGLMARVVGLLQEERQAMEAEVAKEMQKPLRSVVDAYHERDVSLIKTNKTFIKNFDVWLRKLGTP